MDTTGPAAGLAEARDALSSWTVAADAAFALRDFEHQAAGFRRHRAWWARNDPVAYVFLCRLERRGTRVPWSGRSS